MDFHLQLRTRAGRTKRIVYDVMTRIAPRGVAAVGDDPTRAHVYRLDSMFPRTTTKATATETPDPAV